MPNLDRRRFAAVLLQAVTASGCHSPRRSDTTKETFCGTPSHAPTAENVTQGLNLHGMTALITGCDAGIGLETTRVLIERGATVYGLARTLEKAESTATLLNGPGSHGRMVPFACELTDFNSVRHCSDRVRSAGNCIDILICNAGVYLLPTLELAEGLEKQLVVNHLSHFLLVNRLLDMVLRAPQGRIVAVGSDAFSWAPKDGIAFDNLSGQLHYDPASAYGQSKLANGLFVRALSKRLCGTCATANVANPGWVMTQTMRKYVQSLPPEHRPDAAKAKTVPQGAATVCYVATAPTLRYVSGAYFQDCALARAGGYMEDDALAEALWRRSEQLLADHITGH